MQIFIELALFASVPVVFAVGVVFGYHGGRKQAQAEPVLFLDREGRCYVLKEGAKRYV